MATKDFERTQYPKPARWIAPAGARGLRGCVFRARRRVDRTQLDQAGWVYIAAESRYMLYVNGVCVGTGPARGTRACNFLDRHNAAAHLKSGENIIAVEVFCDNFPTYVAAPAEPALFFTSGSLFTDETWQVQIAKEYRTQDVQKYTSQIGLMEWRDLRQAPQDWERFQDDSTWFPACMIPDDRPIRAKTLFLRDVATLQHTRLLPKDIPVVRALMPLSEPNAVGVAGLLSTEPHLPMSLDARALLRGETVYVPAASNGGGVTLIIDFGKEFIGHFQMDIDAPAGTIVDIGYQEEIQDERLQLHPAEGYHFADRYILGEGRRQISNPLRRRGGRYMQLAMRGFDRPIRLHGLTLIDERYPIEVHAEFSCDSDFHNTLWHRCLATLSVCATDTVMDCPWREMAFWVNDFLVVNRFWLEMVNTADLPRRCMALALSQREANGLIGGVCPTDDNPYVVLFATNLFLPLALKDYLAYTGDRQFVEAVLDETADLVDQCEKFADASGMLCPPKEIWNFVDWSFQFTNRPLDGKNACVVNWFHVHALQCLADLYSPCNPQKASEYRQRAARKAAQIDHIFWDNQRACFLEWLGQEASQAPELAGKLTHALALLSGHLNPDRRSAVEQALFRDDLHLPELYMLYFVFEAMAGIGRLDEVHRLIHRYWGPILQSGSPTIWEFNVHRHGKQAIGGVGSLCHAFSLAPVNVMQRHVLGIAPLSDGFGRFSINPCLGGMQHVRGTVRTPRGVIKLSCDRQSGGTRISLSVPRGCVGILPDGREVPAGDHETIVEDGCIVSEAHASLHGHAGIRYGD